MSCTTITDSQARDVGSGDGFGTFWLRGLCCSCAPLRGMQRRFDVPSARVFSHKRYICVECESACCEESIEAYESCAKS